MINTLYLPELRELIAEHNSAELIEFCTAMHPARTAEFMEGLTAEEAWSVLAYAEPERRIEIFGYFSVEQQIEIVQTQDRGGVADLIGEMPADDRVDLLTEVDPTVVGELLPRLPAEDRREFLRLSAYPDDTAGSVMTTELAKLPESMTVGEAFVELGRQASQLETIYYLYIVDDANHDHLRGLVSARQLVSAMGHPETSMQELMERDVVTVHVTDDQEEVARKVARFDLLAIPVVDDDHRLLGIITHDDVIDVVREEATEDAHRIAAVDPLEESYLDTHLLTLTWKRGMWLVVLFVAALLTAFALHSYREQIELWAWLVVFIPLVISSGGNTGSQSATLIITALSTGDIELRDWKKVIRRELAMGLLLGGFLAAIGFVAALPMAPDVRSALVIPCTLLLVVICGAFSGSVLPLVFKRLGLDPAMMSNPFVAGLIDILGIIIYMKVALWLLVPPD
jgi:magnesium transporter